MNARKKCPDGTDNAGNKEQFILLLTTNLSTIMEKEMKYEVPEVEVLEMEVELGFAGSGQGEDLPPID